MKFLPLLFSLLVATPCFAEAINTTTTTSEPDDKDLGTSIDMLGSDFTKKITVDKNKYLLVDPSFINIKVIKDAQTNLNHFNALIGYNIYSNGIKDSPTQFLYFQCPIIRSTDVSRLTFLRDEIVDGVKQSISSFDTENLKTETLSSGYYRFLSKPENNAPPLSSNFPMTGKINQHFDIELMCLQIHLSYLKSKLAEQHRNKILKSFGIVE